MGSEVKKFIMQGLPGVGKTTLIKKVAHELQDLKVNVSGFYTEELRDANHYRVGFDIVTLDNKRGTLARKGGNESKYKVGNYNVLLDEFESIVLSIFEKPTSVMIIDEIGKMELFSKKFEQAVRKVILDKEIIVIATLPLKGQGGLISQIKQNPTCTLITVNANNRNQLCDDVVSRVMK